MADAQRTLESAADFTRGGGAPTPDHDADHASRAGRIEAEQRRLIQWARENGKLGSSGRRPPVFAGGGEHNVFYQKRTQPYIKATRLDRHKGYGIALGSLTHVRLPPSIWTGSPCKTRFMTMTSGSNESSRTAASPSSSLHNHPSKVTRQLKTR